jgi:Cof subfamily protein (haloacid dehalogenase superfamily)
MVVSDMDGTLLNANHEVSDLFFDLYQHLKTKHIQFVAASGRQYNSIVEKLGPIKDDIIVIAENGGFVMQKEQEIMITPLEKEAKVKVLELLEVQQDIHPVLCGKHMAHISSRSSAFKDKLEEYYSSYHVMDDLMDHTGEIIKVALYHFESSEKYIYPLVKSMEATCKVKISGEHWVDISSPNAHKGYALQHIMNQHYIGADEVMVFGDYNNDLEMLALSNYSVAMENAHPNVKAAANYITSSNNNFGVERILKQLLSQL